MENSIHNLDTKQFSNETGEFPAVVMGLDLFDKERLSPFLDHVVAQFKNQRMCSPPDTANMTVTIAGDITADDFCALWNSRMANDPILKQFMSMMVVADVLHIRQGKLLDTASLLGNEAASDTRRRKWWQFWK
jgi:hypothetical protein